MPCVPAGNCCEILLGFYLYRRTKNAFFESGGKFPPLSHSNVREPGVNPGRLRHCYGYNSQCHCPRAGRREEARSRSQDTGLTALVCSERFGALLRKEKDGASPPSCFLAEFVECLRSPFCGMKAFCVYACCQAEPDAFFHAGLSTKTVSQITFCATKLKDQS